MDNLMRRLPTSFGVLSQLGFDIDRFLNSFWNDDFFTDELKMTKSLSKLPKINVSEEKDKFLIEAAVPGIDKKDIEILISGNRMLIKYEKSDKKESDDKSYLMRELSYRAFERVIPFPVDIDESSIKAKLVDGLLRIEIGKAETVLPKDKKIIIS